jgi:hypothetical protein
MPAARRRCRSSEWQRTQCRRETLGRDEYCQRSLRRCVYRDLHNAVVGALIQHSYPPPLPSLSDRRDSWVSSICMLLAIASYSS